MIKPGGPRRKRRQGGLVRLLATGVAIAAIVKELRLPREDRTWHGMVGGLVPYDFRRPTVDRVRERLWSPDSSRLITPAVFGVGWSVNLGRIVTLVRPEALRT